VIPYKGTTVEKAVQGFYLQPRYSAPCEDKTLVSSRSHLPKGMPVEYKERMYLLKELFVIRLGNEFRIVPGRWATMKKALCVRSTPRNALETNDFHRFAERCSPAVDAENGRIQSLTAGRLEQEESNPSSFGNAFP